MPETHNQPDAPENPALRNARVFTDRRMKAGLPHPMYILLVFLNGFALVLAIKFWSLAAALAFLVFALLTIIPVYLIHSEDADAHLVWRRVIFSGGLLNNSHTTRRTVVFIRRGD